MDRCLFPEFHPLKSVLTAKWKNLMHKNEYEKYCCILEVGLQNYRQIELPCHSDSGAVMKTILFFILLLPIHTKLTNVSYTYSMYVIMLINANNASKQYTQGAMITSEMVDFPQKKKRTTAVSQAYYYYY